MWVCVLPDFTHSPPLSLLPFSFPTVYLCEWRVRSQSAGPLTDRWVGLCAEAYAVSMLASSVFAQPAGAVGTAVELKNRSPLLPYSLPLSLLLLPPNPSSSFFPMLSSTIPPPPSSSSSSSSLTSGCQGRDTAPPVVPPPEPRLWANGRGLPDMMARRSWVQI